MRLLDLGIAYAVRLFPNEADLSDYTLDTGKTLPADEADGLLEYLLRHINNPRSDAQSSLPRFTGVSRSRAGGANADAL